MYTVGKVQCALQGRYIVHCRACTMCTSGQIHCALQGRYNVLYRAGTLYTEWQLQCTLQGRYNVHYRKDTMDTATTQYCQEVWCLLQIKHSSLNTKHMHKFMYIFSPDFWQHSTSNLWQSRGLIIRPWKKQNTRLSLQDHYKPFLKVILFFFGQRLGGRGWGSTRILRKKSLFCQ